MCYSCLARNEGTSWASFGHDMGQHYTSGNGQPLSANENGYDPSQAQFAMDAAGMAAGAPIWSTIGNWVEDTANSVYDYVSNNVSRAPLTLFSTLAELTGGTVGNVRYAVPTGLDPDVLALFTGSQWATYSVTYSLPDSRGDYEAINPSASGYRPLTFETEQAIRYILEGYSPYAGGPGMSMTSVEGFTNLSLNYAGRNGADMQIGGYNPSEIINRSHGYYPGVPVFGGDVWLEMNAKLPGSYAYFITMHELGHGLGLKHPHDSGWRLPTMSKLHDSPEYTVMSYVDFKDHPQIFMQYDITALQAMYGADFFTNNANAGNTTYRWSSTTGEAFVNGVGQGKPFVNYIFQTIWDGGGTDTYDLSNYHDGNDSLWGGTGDDRLYGENGNDFVAGESGNDYIEGGYGHDSVFGGTGNDTIWGGTTGDDRLYGEDGNDVIYGENGNDHVEGNAGSDQLMGHDGNDTIYGGTEGDTIWGGAGNDYLAGEGGADRFVFDTALNGWSNVDQIIGFNVYEDRIELSRGVFGGFGPSVSLATGSGANAWNSQVVYNNQTGELFYDADGLGAASAQIKFAVLSPYLALTSQNFILA